MSGRIEEVAALAKAMPLPGAKYVEEVYRGRWRVLTMTWGFPRPMKSKRTGLPIKPKAVNNARDDRLLTPFWRSSFEKRRCLIPVTQWTDGSVDEAMALVRTCDDTLVVDRTTEPWFKRKAEPPDLML